MDFNKLSNGEKIALIGGGASVIALFLPWFGVSIPFLGSANWNAFQAGFLAWGGALFAIAGAAVLILATLGKQKVEAGGFGPQQIATALGALGFVLVLIRTFSAPAGLSMKFGVFVGLLAAAAVAAGSFMAMKDAGLGFSAGGSGGGDASGGGTPGGGAPGGGTPGGGAPGGDTGGGDFGGGAE